MKRKKIENLAENLTSHMRKTLKASAELDKVGYDCFDRLVKFG